MQNLIPAAQLYTVRAYTQTPEGLRETFRKVAETGYPSVQISAIGPIPAPFIRDALAEYGLTCCVTHSDFGRMQTDLGSMIEEHKTFGCNVMGIGAMPGEYRGSLEGYRAFLSIINPIARELSKNGMHLSYHNHNFEFERYGDRLGMDILLDEADPNVEFVLDSFWIQAGGGNPVEYIKKADGRMSVFHLKDMKIKEGKQLFAPIFEGSINFLPIFEACRQTKVQYIAVEQDDCYGEDPFDCLGRSYRNIMANL